MALTIKPAYVNIRIGFNNSAAPLGQRSQEDLKLFLILSYASNRADYVNYFVDPPTLDELLGNAPGAGGAGTNGWSPVLALVADGDRVVYQIADWQGGTGSKPAVGGYVGSAGIVGTKAAAIDVRGLPGVGGGPGGALTNEQLKALLSNEGNVRFDFDGLKIKANLNAILNAAGGLVGFDWLSLKLPAEYLKKDDYDSDTQRLLDRIVALEGGGGPPSAFDPTTVSGAAAVYYNDTAKGVVLETSPSTKVLSQANRVGAGANNNRASTTSSLRPTYLPTGGPNGKPAFQFSGASSINVASFILPAGTKEISYWAVLKNTGTNTAVLVETPSNYSNSTGSFILALDDPQGKMGMGIKGDAGDTSGPATIPTGAFFLLCVKVRKSSLGDQVEVLVNGQSVWQNNGTANNTNDFTSGATWFFGSRGGTSLFANMVIAAEAIYSTWNSVADTAYLEAGFKSEFGLVY